MSRKIIYTVISCLVLLNCPSQGYGKSLAGLVKEGNAAYNAGEYDKAVSSYDEALRDAPESPYVYFNKGAALYKKGDYTGAAEAFEKAALNSKDPRFEAKSRFNQGNSAYKEAEALKEKDLQKVLDGCSKGITRYQDALKLDPDLKEAAENIEMVRLVMKNILEEIKKQKEANQDDQEKKKQTADKLKEIIKEQESALEKNQKLDAERTAKGDTPEVTKEIGQLSKEQKGVRDKTDALLKDLKNDNNADASKDDKVTQHVKNAVTEQDAAAGNLDQQNTKDSADNQKKAIKELKDALDDSVGNSNNGTGEDKENQQAKQEGQGQKESAGDESKQQAQGDQTQGQEALGNLSDDAQDILNDEKENKEQRRALNVRIYKEVEKDW